MALLAPLLIAPKLWFQHQFFGPLPTFDWLPSIPPVLEAAMYGALVLLLPPIALLRDPRRLIAVWCALFACRAAVDQSVWQPYFFQYIAMLLSLYFLANAERGRSVARSPVLNVNRLIVVSVYFWSGLNKINHAFLTSGLKAIPGLEELVSSVSPWIEPQHFEPISILIPLVETSLAVGLLFAGRLRKAAAVAAIAMHVLILLSIGPFGLSHNEVVWPWNVAMISFVGILFLQNEDVPVRWVLWNATSNFHKVVLVLFAVFPLLSLAGLWPSSLSFSLYTFRHPHAEIFITEPLRSRLPAETRAQFQEQSIYFDLETSTGHRKVGPYVGAVSISDWSEAELRAFVPQEPRVYKLVFEKVCALAQEPTDALLVLLTPPDLVSGARRQSARACEP